MNDRIQLDGKTYIALAGAIEMSGMSEASLRSAAASGRVLLRAVGKSVYVESDSLKNLLETPESFATSSQALSQSARPAVASKPLLSVSLNRSNILPVGQLTFTAPLPLAPVCPSPKSVPIVIAPIVREVPAVTPLLQQLMSKVRSATADIRIPTPSALAATLLNPVRSIRVAPAKSFLQQLMSKVRSATADIRIPAPSAPVAPLLASAHSIRLASAASFLRQLSSKMRVGTLDRNAVMAGALAVVVIGVGGFAFANISTLSNAVANIGKPFRVVPTSQKALVDAAVPRGQASAIGVGASTSATGTANTTQTPSVGGTSSAISSTQPIYYVYNYPVIERIIERDRLASVQGIGEELLNIRLKELDASISARLAALSSSNTTQITNVYAAAASMGRIEHLDGLNLTNPTITGGSISGVSFSASELSGIVDIDNGGTGTSTAPSYGLLLLGNSSGTYDLVATSSLGIVGGTGATLSAANTWTALQLFSANASSTQLSVFNKAYFGATATSTFDSAGNLSVAGTLGVTGDTTLANATSTNFFATTASSTNLFSTNGTINALTAGTLNLTTLAAGSGTFSGTLGVTGLSSFTQSSTTRLSVFDKAYFGGTATTTIDSAGNLLVMGSTTLQNFTATNATTTNATSTNFFATTASSTNLFATTANLGVLTAGTLNLTTALPATSGGTGQSTVTTGDLLYGSGTNAWGKLGVGTAGYVLGVSGGLPAWVATTTFSSGLSYASGNVTLNTANANTWSALQLFSANASSTQLSVFNKAYFGATATSTFDSTGALTLVNALTYGGVTLSNAVTGTGNMVLSASPTFTGTAIFANTTNSGTLGVTGLSSFTQASSTRFSVFDKAYFGATATSTFDSAGNLSVAGTLGVTGDTTLANATSTNFFATTASSTNLFSTNGTINALTAGTLNLTTLTGGSSTFSSTLSVTGASTFIGLASFTQASTTRLSVFDKAYFGGSATSTFDSTGALTLTGALTYGGVTLSNAVTGTGNMVLSTSPTLTGTLTAAAANFSGNVGVGTTTPYSKLTVWGASTGTNKLAEWVNSASTTLASILENGTAYFLGNVGIGTTTPFRKLSVTDTVSAAQVAFAYDATRYAELRVDSTGDLNMAASGGDTYFNNDNFWVCTGGSISSNGCPSGSPTGVGNIIAENKIGIGTSTPAYKLTIETQDTTTNFFQVASSTAQSLFVINANGNIGVGTSSPFSRLAIGPGGSIMTTEGSLSDGATITVSWNDGNQQKVTLGGNRTINFTNYIAGGILRLVVCQDATGSRTITWDSNILWQGGTAPTLTTTANKCDLTTFVATGATSTLKIFGAAALAF